MGSYAASVEDAFGLLEDGKYLRFTEALLPSALANPVKTVRYIMEDGVRTRDGLLLPKDLNATNTALQVLGFSPADISNMYERRAMTLNFQAKVVKRKKALLDKLYIATENGDVSGMVEAQQEIAELGSKYPGLITPTTIERSLKSQRAYQQDLNNEQLRLVPGIENRVNRMFLDEI